MTTPLDRFLRYVAFDTQSSAKTGNHPSTPGQLVLSDSIADELRALGCDVIQGYYYSKPIPVEEYENKYLS